MNSVSRLQLTLCLRLNFDNLMWSEPPESSPASSPFLLDQQDINEHWRDEDLTPLQVDHDWNPSAWDHNTGLGEVGLNDDNRWNSNWNLDWDCDSDSRCDVAQDNAEEEEDCLVGNNNLYWDPNANENTLAGLSFCNDSDMPVPNALPPNHRIRREYHMHLSGMV